MKEILVNAREDLLLEVFRDQIPFDLIPEYLLMIAYPICIDSILERLESGYYRDGSVNDINLASCVGLGPYDDECHGI